MGAAGEPTDSAAVAESARREIDRLESELAEWQKKLGAVLTVETEEPKLYEVGEDAVACLCTATLREPSTGRIVSQSMAGHTIRCGDHECADEATAAALANARAAVRVWRELLPWGPSLRRPAQHHVRLDVLRRRLRGKESEVQAAPEASRLERSAEYYALQRQEARARRALSLTLRVTGVSTRPRGARRPASVRRRARRAAASSSTSSADPGDSDPDPPGSLGTPPARRQTAGEAP